MRIPIVFLVVSSLANALDSFYDFVGVELINLKSFIDHIVGCSLGDNLNTLSSPPVYIHPFLDANETIHELPRLQECKVVESWSQHRISNETYDYYD